VKHLACALGLAWLAPLPVHAQTPSATIVGVGFVGSEAARYDERRDEYLVSNRGPSSAPDQSFVSRVSPDGNVIELKWIEHGRNGVTLLDPLGIFLHGDLLYVADIAAVRLFDRSSGAPHGSVEIPGAVRLNDLAVARDGTVYVSDSGADGVAGAIYKISPQRRVTAFVARDPALERVNGIAVMPDGNIVHGGRGVNLVFRSPKGAVLREQTLPTGRIDGIVAMADGGLLVASQDGHGVYHVPRGKEPMLVARDIPIPAAIGLDTKRARLLVPQIQAGSLTFVELPRP